MMILVLAERSKVDTLQERKTPKALKIQALGRVQSLLPRLRLVDGVSEPYTYEKLTNMYRYLNGKGELYFIEVYESGEWKPIGDVTFWQEDMPIVIGDARYRGRGIGKRVVSALVERGRALGYDRLYVGEIYNYNTASKRCFESVGFRAYEQTAQGWRYVLELTEP